MSPKMNLRRSLALTTALVVTAFGAAPAVAYDPGNGNGNGNGHNSSAGKSDKSEKDKKDKGEKSDNGKGPKDKGPKSNNGNGPKDKGPKSNNGNGPKDKGPKGNNGGGNGNGNGPGNSNAGGNGNGGGKGDKGPKGDPAGNNGTVKITPIGQDDGIPQNNPHVPCGFDIEWYGFDEGPDIISKVTLVPHAPTSDVTMDIGGPSEVFVGGDPASGAGTDSGFDGEATYYPTFVGEPHPKQGYHVKLTVNTPGSQGSDAKHKVFWIEPCEEEAPGTEEPGTETPGEETPGEEECTDEMGGSTGSEECEETEGTTEEECTEEMTEGSSEEECAEVEGTQEGDDDSSTNASTDEGEVAGTQAAAGNAAGADSGSEVPTAVDAGEEGNPVVNAITSPLGLLLMLGGLAIAGAALVARRQTR